MIDSVFFAKEGEKGLNETSASHLCAMASQIKDQSEKVLENVSFINTTLNIVGAGEQGSMSVGVGISQDKLCELQSALDKISRMNAFIAWFAEARKTLEYYKVTRSAIGFEEWIKEENIEVPLYPTMYNVQKTPTMKDAIETLSIKDRQTYLALEAKASTFGRFIHPDNPMEIAREKLHKIIVKPYMTQGEGQNTLVYHNTPSLDVESVDHLFNRFQQEYRKTEQSLNHMKSDIRKKLDEMCRENKLENERRIAEYKKEMDDYNIKMAELRVQYEQWMRDEATKNSKIKFAIPNNLADIVEELNGIGDN